MFSRRLYRRRLFLFLSLTTAALDTRSLNALPCCVQKKNETSEKKQPLQGEVSRSSLSSRIWKSKQIVRAYVAKEDQIAHWDSGVKRDKHQWRNDYRIEVRRWKLYSKTFGSDCGLPANNGRSFARGTLLRQWRQCAVDTRRDHQRSGWLASTGRAKRPSATVQDRRSGFGQALADNRGDRRRRQADGARCSGKSGDVPPVTPDLRNVEPGVDGELRKRIMMHVDFNGNIGRRIEGKVDIRTQLD